MPDQLSLRGLSTAGATEGDAVTLVDGAWAPAPGGSAYREVLMASGVTSPPEPLESSDGTDWLYGEAG